MTAATPQFTPGQRFQFTVGQAVICNGFPGTIYRVCEGPLKGLVDVRVPGGLTCVSASYPDVFPARALQAVATQA